MNNNHKLLLLTTLLATLHVGQAFWHSRTTWGRSHTSLRHATPSNALSTAYPSLQNTTTYKSLSTSNNNLAGLSKFHQSILSRTCDRQRFVTGRYPLCIQVVENPTRQWLRIGREASAETEILVNGTSPDRSLASFDRFQWLDDSERAILASDCSMVSLELIAEIHTERPGYLQLLSADGAGSSAALLRVTSWNSRWQAGKVTKLMDSLSSMPFRERLWVTGFSLAGRRGLLKSMEAEDGHCTSVNPRTAQSLLWPNEVVAVPAHLIDGPVVSSMSSTMLPVKSRYQDALLVCDGFLVPGKDRGGLYMVKHPGNPQTEWTVCLTPDDDRWFYHRASWLDLTGDGRQSILTARCRVSTFGNKDTAGVTTGITKTGELVWLECPQPASMDPQTGTPLESDGTVFDPFSRRHVPWKAHVLARGPDVMFCVADMDEEDDTVEVLSSQFFGKKVVLHSIRRGPSPAVVEERVIDDECGAAFGSILTNLDGQVSSGPRVVDSGSTVGTVRPGEPFTHLLVTSHECTYASKDKASGTKGKPAESAMLPGEQAVTAATETDGGSLFAYRVPMGKGAWKTERWVRSTVASGFKVNGQLSNMINPGAPGFVYTFHAKKSDRGTGKRPLIAVAGDCAESAYLFRPAGTSDTKLAGLSDPSAHYKPMVEIQCGATVGSLGVGYDEFASAEQEAGYAKVYVPCFEKDKILVFALGNGDSIEEEGEW